MFVEDLSSKYPKLSPYGPSVCGRTDGCGWTVRSAVLDILNSNFLQTSIERTLETLQARKSGVIIWSYVAKIFTSPVTHRSLKIALATLGDRGLWGGSIIWKGANCLNLDTRYLHISLLLFFTSVFLESWTPTLLKILDFWIYGFCAARAYGPYGWRPYGYVRIRIQITPIWNFYHVTSNFLAILLKFLALNWHSSTLLISIGSGDITDFRRPI